MEPDHEQAIYQKKSLRLEPLQMKFKYTGEQAEVTIRDTTFPSGKAVEVSDELAAKISRLDDFKEVKSKAKKDGNKV